jgi:hypothetical protein
VTDAGAGGAAGAPTGADDENAELVRLRAQVGQLKEELEHVRPGSADQETVVLARSGRTGWWRTLVATVCIVLAALLAPLAVVATWAHDQVGNTDRYLQTVTPLATDPAVQNAIVARVTDEIFTRLDVEAVTEQAVQALQDRGLPPRVATSLNALSTPLAGAVRNFVSDQVRKLVESPQFVDAWVTANRTAHEQMVTLLTGKDSDTVTVTDNAVKINLAVFIETVKQILVDKGFTLAGNLPTVNAEFTIFESADLAKAQNGFKVLSALARWLAVVGLALIAVAVYVAKSRRRALLAAGLAVAGGMLLLGVTLNVLRPVYLSAIPEDQLPHDAAGVIYDQVVSFIRFSLRAVLVVALAVAIGAWLTGQSSSALATRRGIAAGAAAVRGGGEHIGVNTGSFGAFLYRYRTLCRGAIIGVAALLYLAADHPTGSWTLKVLVVVVVLLLVLEVLARPPRREDSALPAG